MNVSYDIIARIENESNNLLSELEATLELILSAEERVLNDNEDSLDDGYVANPYDNSYHFANIGATWYTHGDVYYNTYPSKSYVTVTQSLVYGDGDYATEITRDIPYSVFAFTNETQFYDFVFTKWCEMQVERRAEAARMEEERLQESLQAEIEKDNAAYEQYLELKERFEHA